MPDNPAELGLLGLYEEEEEGSFTQICPDLTQPGSRMGRNWNTVRKFWKIVKMNLSSLRRRKGARRTDETGTPERGGV
ncbi:hypothetical protein CEXT_426111 [Caerostris extrusa]|uniref:Uncharacterized protein n=1 Tax=Caerostris extrusa TaxID=172846 RepID=A0AAV4QX89_CAEEX|nr:hypothetical protein CEXT_426111 [Caerostris extrusa]